MAYLLAGVKRTAHDPAKDVEAGRVLGGVLLGRMHHQPSILKMSSS